MGLIDIISSFGDKTGEVANIFIRKISEMGLEISSTSSKVIVLLFNLLLIYLFIKIITIPKKPLKLLIIGVLIFLAVSLSISIIA